MSRLLLAGTFYTTVGTTFRERVQMGKLLSCHGNKGDITLDCEEIILFQVGKKSMERNIFKIKSPRVQLIQVCGWILF